MAAAEGAFLQFDVRAFYAKRVRDYGDAARANGDLPETAPFMGINSCEAGGLGPVSWGAAHVTLALQLFARYGDRQLVQDTYALTVRPYLRLLNATAVWYAHALGAGATAQLTSGLADIAVDRAADCDGQCDCPLLTIMGTVFLHQQAVAAVRAAAIAGAGADEIAALGAIADAAALGFVNQFFHNDTASVGAGQIDETLWALWSGAVPEAARPRAWANVAALLRARGHLYTGAIGTGILFSLGPDGGAGAGLNDAILEALQQRDFPGYGFQIAGNATSLFEHWDGSGSQNHAWYGSVAGYFRRQLVGISLDEATSVGYDHVVIRPHPPTFGSAAARTAGGGGGLPWANATHSTVRGPIAVQWRYEQGPGADVTMRLSVALPGNAAAGVFVPHPLAGAAVTARGACALAGAPTAEDDGYDVYDLGNFAGECEFFVTSSSSSSSSSSSFSSSFSSSSLEWRGEGKN